MTETFSLEPTCSMYRLTMTSQNFSPSSIMWQIRPVYSQAISVLPEPPNGSSTSEFVMLEFMIG